MGHTLITSKIIGLKTRRNQWLFRIRAEEGRDGVSRYLKGKSTPLK
jgi:hypothetical protein